MLLERESPSIRKAVSRAALKPLFFRPLQMAPPP